MNPKLRKYSVIGLYVALAAALTTLGLYIVYKEFNLGVQVGLGCIVIGLALFAILDPQRVREVFTGRQAKYGSNAFVMGLATLGILIIVNYLVYNYNKTWDLTQDKANTLTQETIDLLKSMPDKVTAQAFFTSQASTDSARAILTQYKSASEGNFNFEFIDPIKDPVAAQNANITSDGMVVLRMGDNQEPVTYLSEQEIDTALIKLINPQSRSVYFLTGHGEHDITSSSQEDGLSSLKTILESKNYAVSSLNLLLDNQIPEDASVIVINGPRKPLSQREVDLIKTFLGEGKALILLQDSVAQISLGNEADPLAEYIASDWGLVMNPDLVVDLTSQSATVAIGNPSTYGSSPITSSMRNLATVFPVARSITASEISGITYVSLVTTSSQSWGEVSLEGIENTSAQYDEGIDFLGPLTLVYTAENSTNQSRLVLFGDTDFSVNGNLTAYGNSDLLVNSIDWTTGLENLISLTPRTTTSRVLVTPKVYTLGLIFLLTIIIIPGVVVLSGILVWAGRKKRG
ncbi:MAG: GldG family protein [Anaerolineaceae bacterium]|nr:GldG family protein [Anaerolineaceae bacterium]MBN2678185.1 GldG family protein [Anaerolineaceae bacterium]